MFYYYHIGSIYVAQIVLTNGYVNIPAFKCVEYDVSRLLHQRASRADNLSCNFMTWY